MVEHSKADQYNAISFSLCYYVPDHTLLTHLHFQTASIVTGLPYTIIMSFLCVSLWRGLAMEFGDLNPYGADFSIGIIDPFATWDPKLWCNFAKYIFMT